MNRAVIALLLLVLLVVLVACGISSGNVVGKEHHDGYTTLIPISTGKTVVLVPTYQPECWQLNLRAGQDDGSVCVDPLTWDRTRIGDYYSEPEGN